MRRWRGLDFQIYPALLLLNRIASEHAYQCFFPLCRASSSINYGTTSDVRSSDEPLDLFRSPHRRVQGNYPTRWRRELRSQTCQVKRQITYGVIHSRPRRERRMCTSEVKKERKWEKRSTKVLSPLLRVSRMGKHQHRSTRISNSVLKFIWPSPLNR